MRLSEINRRDFLKGMGAGTYDVNDPIWNKPEQIEYKPEIPMEPIKDKDKEMEPIKDKEKTQTESMRSILDSLR